MSSEPSSRRIFNITITEVLFVLIFSVTAAVIISQIELDNSVEEKDILLDKLNDLEKLYNNLERKIYDLEAENKVLKEEVEDLNRVIDNLSIGDGRGLSDESTIRSYAADLEREIERLKEIIILREEALLRKKGGTGLSKCTYGDIPIKQLLRVSVYDDYFELVPLWKLSDDKVFSQVDWIKEIQSKRRYSLEEFRLLGEKHLEWANAQIPSCRYHVRAYDRTQDARLFLTQRDEIDNKFIACHVIPETEDPTNRENEKCRGFK